MCVCVNAGKRCGKKVNKKARQGESSGERGAEDEINACGLHELLLQSHAWLWTYIHIAFAFFAFLCPPSARQHMYRTTDISVHSGVCAFVHVSDLCSCEFLCRCANVRMYMRVRV